MGSSTDKSFKTEIVSPAGNLEKLKIAVKYGADTVYFGGEHLNLRGMASNFKKEEIYDAVSFCNENSVKTIFLMNSFLHENNIAVAQNYINEIKDINFHAIMISDPGILLLLREAKIQSHIHLSTQMSTLNHLSIKFWNGAGIKRIVLARETTLEEIKKIRHHTSAEIEIFVHGALCISYSGRCLLSRYLSGRDANQGLCSHPCRWRYALIEEKRPGNHLEIIEHANETEILSSKDLSLITKIPQYIDAGVNAFKIEGRMKSLYYTANTTRIYKHAVELYSRNKNYDEYIDFWQQELDLVSHRPYTDDLFNEFDNMGFTEIPYIKKVLFLGYKIDDNKDNRLVSIKIFNPIYRGEEIEAIFPIKQDRIIDDKYIVEEIIDNENKTVEMAQPGKIYNIKLDKPVPDDAVFRRRLIK